MRRKSRRGVMAAVTGGVLLVIAGALGWLAPVKSATGYLLGGAAGSFARAGSRTGNFLATVGSIKDLSSENAQLRAEVAQLRERLSEDAELRQQNEALRKQLSFGEAAPRQLIPAEVIGYQPDNFRQFLTIGRGSKDGLKEGMAVIAEGSLVGKVAEVTATSAKVFLVTDPNFRVNGLDQETRATGTVRGQIGTGLLMEKIAQSETVRPGDTIISSGLGGELPRGLIIGRVESVNQHDNAVFQTARIVSSLKFPRLELVFVVAG
jgi:rod shape-determining protein MreC